MNRALVWLLGMLNCCALSDEAYLSPMGKITPCLAPCTDYGVAISPRGSYSTLKMSVYKFDIKKNSFLLPTDIDRVATYPDKVPLDLTRIFNDTKSIASAMMPLIKAAKEAIPVAFHLTTPIFFSIDERTKAVNQAAWFKTLSSVLGLFANKTVPFLVGPFSVKANYVFEEASYKWQVLNFLLGNFQEHRKTVAALSFNGKMESEISYEKFIIDREVQQVSTIRGESRAIASSTFFRSGSSYPLYKYFGSISSPKTSIIKSPCGLKGLKKQFRGMYTAKLIEATGDIDKCREVIRNNLLSVCDKAYGCAYLKGKINSDIIAFPSVASTMEQLGYHECTGDFTPKMLDNAIRRMCGAKPLPAKTNTGAFSKRVKFSKQATPTIINCVNGNFLYLLLTEGYHLSKNTKIKIEKKKLSGLELDPNLGELLTKMTLLK